MPGSSLSMATSEDICVASEDASSSLTTSRISDNNTNAGDNDVAVINLCKDAICTAVSLSFCAAPTPSLPNSQKSSLAWKFLAHFDLVHHPDKKNSCICLVCKDVGVEKSITIGEYYSPTALVNHLHSVHKEQFHKCLLATKEIENEKSKKYKVHQLRTLHCTSQQQQSQQKSLETDLQNGLLLRTCP
jgi:hypothetical protein